MVQADVSTSRKRPVNLTLNEALVAQAKTYTNNLSATMEELLAQYVAVQHKAMQTVVNWQMPAPTNGTTSCPITALSPTNTAPCRRPWRSLMSIAQRGREKS